MRTALHRRARTVTASTAPRVVSMDAWSASQAVRPAPMHDIGGVSIADVAQRKQAGGINGEAYRAPNRTGLPDRLKASVEARSGLSLDRVRVHSNSKQPAQLDAHAYARGADIHVAPGQDRYLAHEAWHVVQQAQGRVRPTAQMASGVRINDDPALEAEADRFQTDLGSVSRSSPLAGNDGMVAQPGSPGVVQRVVEVDKQTYSLGGRGHGMKALTDTIRSKAEEKSVTLKYGWKSAIEDEVRADATTPYDDWDHVLNELKKDTGTAYEKRKRKIEEQDVKIKASLKGADKASKRSRAISYETKKALASVREHIRGTDQFKNTVAELEALPAGEMDDSVATEVSATKHPAVLFEALLAAKTKRLDFNFHGTPIVTHGYESMGDRTVDASTLREFGLGPVKVGGKDVGSYSQMLEADEDIPIGDNLILAVLEMLRIPITSAMVALKRDLYAKGETELSEAMAIDSPKTNVEYLGAVGGAGHTKPQKGRMQQQQITSNEMTLDDYVARFPHHEIGTQTEDKKPRATPEKIDDAFNEYMELMNNSTATKEELKTAKRKSRRPLTRTIASSMGIEDVELDASVSDVDEQHYETETLFDQ